MSCHTTVLLGLFTFQSQAQPVIGHVNILIDGNMMDGSTTESEDAPHDNMEATSREQQGAKGSSNTKSANASNNRRGVGGGRGRGKGRGRGRISGRGGGRHRTKTPPKIEEMKGEGAEKSQNEEDANKNWAPAMLGASSNSATAHADGSSKEEEESKLEAKKRDRKATPKNRSRSNRKNTRDDVNQNGMAANGESTGTQELDKVKKELEATKALLKESERIAENRKRKYSLLNEKWRLMKNSEASKEGEAAITSMAAEESVLQKELNKKVQELLESEKKSEARKEQLVQLNRLWSQGKKEIQKLKAEVTKLKKDEKDLTRTKAKLAESERVRKATSRRYTLLNEKWAKLKKEGIVAATSASNGKPSGEVKTKELTEIRTDESLLDIMEEVDFDGKIFLTSHESDFSMLQQHSDDPIVDLESNTTLPLSFDERQANLETAQEEMEIDDELYAKELDFIAKAHGEEDVTINKRKITRHVKLPIKRNSESICIDLILNIPAQYPTVGIITIAASLAPNSTATMEANHFAMEHISKLTDLCASEAEACEGHEAIFNIFASADTWIKDEWSVIEAKKFSVQSRN